MSPVCCKDYTSLPTVIFPKWCKCSTGGRSSSFSSAEEMMWDQWSSGGTWGRKRREEPEGGRGGNSSVTRRWSRVLIHLDSNIPLLLFNPFIIWITLFIQHCTLQRHQEGISTSCSTSSWRRDMSVCHTCSIVPDKHTEHVQCSVCSSQRGSFLEDFHWTEPWTSMFH